MRIELDVVLNCNYGGFGICTEMALWLTEHKGWKIIPYSEYDYKKKNEYPLETLLDDRWGIYSPHSESIKFRSHPDLVECILALKKMYEEESDKHFTERKHQYSKEIDDLEVKKITIHLGIESYHDGHERIKCYCSEED